jgi:hypothetical protein
MKSKTVLNNIIKHAMADMIAMGSRKNESFIKRHFEMRFKNNIK